MDLDTKLVILLDALKAELAARGTLDSLCMTGIFTGEMAMDDYGFGEDCGGGMAWVRITGSFPSASFPSTYTGMSPCSYPLAVSVELGINRPAPLPKKFGKDIELPKMAEQLEAVARQNDDMLAMFSALDAAARRMELSVGSYSPTGQGGDLLGGTVSATIGEEDD